jgi:hypothetical protein
MAFHGVGSNVELLSNFFVAEAFRNQFNHLVFPLGHPHRLKQAHLKRRPCPRVIDKREDSMATRLQESLKRELEVNGELYMLTISPERMKLVPKGKRKGHELPRKDLISGQAALAVALSAR